jgi:predicted transcriptional regulator
LDIAVQIRPEQEQRLQQLAAQSGLSADEYLQREVDSILEYQEDMARAVKRGDDDIAAGRLLSNEEVFASLQDRLRGQ